MESLQDVQQLRELVQRARFARCRSRFAVPVILYEGKVGSKSPLLQFHIMGDRTDGAIFNKCDPVSVGLGSTVSLENSLFCTHYKKYVQIK